MSMWDWHEHVLQILSGMRKRDTLDGKDIGLDNFHIEYDEYGGYDGLELVKAYADLIEKALMWERVVISAYTGYLMCPFDEMHKYIEQMMGRPVFTHEMCESNKAFMDELREKVKPDFLALCNAKKGGWA